MYMKHYERKCFIILNFAGSICTNKHEMGVRFHILKHKCQNILCQVYVNLFLLTEPVVMSSLSVLQGRQGNRYLLTEPMVMSSLSVLQGR